tara:strand:+ start:85 stop:810 length:726 start_codon:yes stop_codon:yes gene_type:complete
MGYLDNSSITVDAVLTKKGREILKSGGNLNITSFTLSDTGVDYSLWNPDHTDGSAFYGAAIENLPQLEASVHAEYNLRNRLITLGKKATALPTIVVGGLDSPNGSKITFGLTDNKFNKAQTLNIELLGYSTGGDTPEFFVLVKDPTIVIPTTNTELVDNSMSGVSEQFLSSVEIPNAQLYKLSSAQGLKASFDISPSEQDAAGKQTTLHIYEAKTGAYAVTTVQNDITKQPKQILSSGGIG